MTGETLVFDPSELWVGEGRALSTGRHRLFVLKLADRITCYEDRCPHLGFPLSEGRLEGDTLVCAAHGWVFDAESGLGRNPATCRLRTYPSKLVDGKLVIELGGER